MRLIGFNFSRVSVDKTSNSLKDLKIDSKIDIEDISTVNAKVMQEGQEILQINYVYGVGYEPKIAKIELKGQILLAVSSEQAKEILEGWKKKKLKEDYRITIFNLILRKSSVKALVLEEEMGLPLHIPFPSLKAAKKE